MSAPRKQPPSHAREHAAEIGWSYTQKTPTKKPTQSAASATGGGTTKQVTSTLEHKAKSAKTKIAKQPTVKEASPKKLPQQEVYDRRFTPIEVLQGSVSNYQEWKKADDKKQQSEPATPPQVTNNRGFNSGNRM
jgi:hypothetical protein